VTPTVIVIIVVVLVVAAAAAFLVNKRNKDAKIAQAEELRGQAASRAQSTIAPAQQEAAEAERKAEEARLQAERAQAEAQEAQVAAQQVEAEHEAQVRDADRLDPRVDHKADDYAPQVGGTTDQQPTPPSEANRDEQAAAPGLPQRTRGAQEMPGKPIEKTDEGGGWFTRKDSDTDRA